MSRGTHTAQSSRTTPSNGRSTAPSGLSFGGLVISEWIKASSLRSTWWSLSLVVVISFGLSLIIAATMPPEIVVGDESVTRAFSVQIATAPISFTALVASVLGVLVLSGEYSTGMIRSTFTAVPGRVSAVIAKMLVLFGVLFVVGLVTVIGSFLLTSGLRQNLGLSTTLADDGVLLALCSGALYLALIGLMSFGFGLLTRSAAGGISITIGIQMVLPIIFGILSGFLEWATEIFQWLPSNAGSILYGISFDDPFTMDGQLEYWQALLVLLAWVAVAVVPALLLIKRRDA